MGRTVTRSSPHPKSIQRSHQERRIQQQHPAPQGALPPPGPSTHAGAVGNVFIHNPGLQSCRGSDWLKLLLCHHTPGGFNQWDRSLVGWGQRLQSSRGASFTEQGQGRGPPLPPSW